MQVLKSEELAGSHFVAAEVLGKIGPGAGPAVPLLIEGLRHHYDHRARVEMARALGGIGPAAKDAVPALIQALKRKDLTESRRHSPLHEAAAEALGKIGPLARGAVPVLIEVVKAKDRLEPGEAEKKESVRVAAAIALGRIGPGARAALPVLRQVSKEKRWWDSMGYTRVGDALPPPEPGVDIRAIIVDTRLQPEVRRAIKLIEGE
jgi:HEAT repeat protein